MLLQGKGEQASSNTGSSRVAQHRAPPSLAAAATLSGDSADKSTIWSKSTDTTAGPAEWDMQMIERKHVHNDAISGCVLLLDPQQSLLVTTSLDGGLKVHKLSLSIQADRDDDDERRGFPAAFSRFSYSTILSRGQVVGSMPFQSKLTEYRSHSSRDPLASLVLAHDGISGTVAFAGGHDDVVLAYGVNSGCAVASVYSHRDAVTGLDLISRTPFDPESALWLENSTHIMVSGSWDATVKVWSVCVSKSEAVSISREPLAELFDAESSIVCVSVKSLPDGGIVIAAGCADSSFCAWHVHNDGVQVAIHNEPARRGSGPCSVVKWISVSGTLHLLAAFSTGKVASYSMAGEGLRRDSAVSVGVAVLSLAYTEPGTLLLGCADGCLRLISLQNGAHFDTRPTLWPEVNNKTCPGVTSISTMSFGSGDQSKFLCCTGGSDGSVALFEIKRNKSIN
jgi:WD40 repeat protein